MDIARLHDGAMALQFGLRLPLVAGIVAGLCMLAFISGLSRLRHKNLPPGFPADPEAAQPKYVLAYSHLREGKETDLALAVKIATANNQSAVNLSSGALTAALQPSLSPPKPQAAAKPK
jgi:hypothetical protein